MSKIFIVDDHVVVRYGLKQILSHEPDIEVVNEASTAKEVYEILRKSQKQQRGSKAPWDLVILDISLQDKNGLELLKELKALYPSLSILIFSIHSEEQYAIRVLRAGGSGYLMKNSDSSELIGAVRKILSGKKYISVSLAEKIAFQLGERKEIGLTHESLSDREYESLCLIASGKTITEVAKILCLSAKTVSTYRSRILEKMGMKTNAELTYYAIQNGLKD